MAISASEIIYAGIGFLLIAILVPFAMGSLISTSTSGWNAAVITIFQVLLPVLYLIGSALYFLPKIGKGK